MTGRRARIVRRSIEAGHDRRKAEADRVMGEMLADQRRRMEAFTEARRQELWRPLDEKVEQMQRHRRIYHTPYPGPLHWDWRCRVCSHPVVQHVPLDVRLRRRLLIWWRFGL